MKRITMTYDIAHAAGTDAANASMRSRGLTKWDEACAFVAADTFDKLFDMKAELKDHRRSQQQ